LFPIFHCGHSYFIVRFVVGDKYLTWWRKWSAWFTNNAGQCTVEYYYSSSEAMWMKPGHTVWGREWVQKSYIEKQINKYKIEGQVIESAMKTTTCLPFSVSLASIWVHHPLIIANNKNKQLWPHFRNQSTHSNFFYILWRCYGMSFTCEMRQT